jgi:hypothetical protein
MLASLASMNLRRFDSNLIFIEGLRELRVDGTNNLSHDLISFHRFMTLTNFSPVDNSVDLSLKISIYYMWQSMFQKLIL